MATPAGYTAVTVPGDIDFGDGGMGVQWLTGMFIKSGERKGNVLEVTYQDGNGDEQTMRFIGAPRQPIVGARRLAYIPDGETPTEAHFMAAGKSVSSTTERLPLAGIDGVANHHLAIWYEAALPEIDLVTTDTTIRDNRSSFGGPVPLEVDGVDGYYHVTGSLNGLDEPSRYFDAFYAESRDGEVLTPIYGAWRLVGPPYPITFTAATFTAAASGAITLGDRIVIPMPTVPSIRLTTSATLPVSDAAVWTGTLGESEQIFYSRSAGDYGDTEGFRAAESTVNSYTLIGIPTSFGQLRGISEGSIDRTSLFQRDSNQDITVDGVPYNVWRTASVRAPLAYSARWTRISVDEPFDYGNRFVAIAVPEGHAPITGITQAPEYIRSWNLFDYHGDVTINGLSHEVTVVGPMRLLTETVNVLGLQFGEVPL